MNQRDLETELTATAEAVDVQGERSPSGGRTLEAFLLFQLLLAPSYGYQLVQQVKEHGFGPRSTQPSVIYRALRSLEGSGAIRSTWATQESGPSRRYYELTGPGRELLDRRLAQVRRQVERSQRLLRAYDDHVAATLIAGARA